MPANKIAESSVRVAKNQLLNLGMKYKVLWEKEENTTGMLLCTESFA